MLTLNQFKQQEGVQTIDLLQLNGRAFAKVNDKSLIVSTNCDLKQPLFVTELTEDKNGNPIVGVYAIVNSSAKIVASV